MRISQQIAIIAWWHAIFEKVQWKNASPPHFSLKLIEFFWCALNPSRLEKSFVVCTSKPKLLELFCTFSHDKRYKTYLGLIMGFFNIRSKRFMPIEKWQLFSITTQQIFKRFNIYHLPTIELPSLWKKINRSENTSKYWVHCHVFKRPLDILFYWLFGKFKINSMSKSVTKMTKKVVKIIHEVTAF